MASAGRFNDQFRYKKGSFIAIVFMAIQFNTVAVADDFPWYGGRQSVDMLVYPAQ